MQGLALHQAIGEIQCARSCFALRYLGTTLSRLLPCVKLFRNYNLQACALRQANVWNCNLQSCLASVCWGIKLAGGAIPAHHIFLTCPLIWRFRFIIRLKHAPSCGDSGLSYFFNTAPPLASPAHHTRIYIYIYAYKYIYIYMLYVYIYMYIYRKRRTAQARRPDIYIYIYI